MGDFFYGFLTGKHQAYMYACMLIFNYIITGIRAKIYVKMVFEQT